MHGLHSYEPDANKPAQGYTRSRCFMGGIKRTCIVIGLSMREVVVPVEKLLRVDIKLERLSIRGERDSPISWFGVFFEGDWWYTGLYRVRERVLKEVDVDHEAE